MATESLENAVRSILLAVWDPNNVGDNKSLADEYDPFIPKIVTALESGASASNLELILKDAEDAQESSALPANRTAAALALFKLRA